MPLSDLTSFLDPLAPSGPTSDQSWAPALNVVTNASVVSVDAVDGFGGLTYDGRSLALNSGFGSGWSNADTLPVLLQAAASGTISVGFGYETDWFTQSGGSYSPRYGCAAALADADGKFTLTQPDGTTYQFYDFTQTADPKGAFYQVTAPGGDSMRATSYDSGGRLLDLTYYNHDPILDVDNAYRALDYAYTGARGNIASITLSGGPDMAPLCRQVYAYYDGIANPGFGSAGDLEKVATYYQWDAGLSDFVDANPDTCYFRYYTGAGQKHELERTMLPTDYANALAQGHGDPAAGSGDWAGDGQGDSIAAYTSYYFAYDSDERVQRRGRRRQDLRVPADRHCQQLRGRRQVQSDPYGL